MFVLEPGPRLAGVVWAGISTMAGVNAELAPIVRMTHPAGVELVAAVDVIDVAAVGNELEPGFCFHSWLLLGGVLPIDRHALTIERLFHGVGFDEESTSWLQRRWRHERRIADDPGGGCIVSDQLVVEPRLGFTTPVVAFVVRRVFEHRHRRLLRRFGAVSAA